MPEVVSTRGASPRSPHRGRLYLVCCLSYQPWKNAVCAAFGAGPSSGLSPSTIGRSFFFASNAAHLGKSLLLGSPVVAKLTQYSDKVAETSRSTSVQARLPSRLPNTNCASDPCVAPEPRAPAPALGGSCVK